MDDVISVAKKKHIQDVLSCLTYKSRPKTQVEIKNFFFTFKDL